MNLIPTLISLGLSRNPLVFFIYKTRAMNLIKLITALPLSDFEKTALEFAAHYAATG